jgi:phosphoribosylformimino-5-aminoimidazole carboxamide ribotide isomerase
MIIYPAIDLRGGKVVRLKEGNPNRQITFSDDPVTTAKQWIEQGATWLHIINLDGAFNDTNNNSRILEAIAKLNVKVQFGGGLRTLDAVAEALNRGASRVVIGTLAVQQPDCLDEAVRRFGSEAVCVALDARDGKIATHGWQNISEQTPLELGRLIAKKGIRHALYTDVKRDGSLAGVNTHDTIELARATGLRVIASGGVGHVDEIRELARSKVVAGAIIGMALYEGKLTLQDALSAAREV